MPCHTVINHTKGKPDLCGKPATTYTVTRGTDLQLSVTAELCVQHAQKALREGYTIHSKALPTTYTTLTNRSTHCQS